MAGRMKSKSWQRRPVSRIPLTPAILKEKKEAAKITKENRTLVIDGDTYIAQINDDDDDCPVSIKIVR